MIEEQASYVLGNRVLRVLASLTLALLAAAKAWAFFEFLPPFLTELCKPPYSPVAQVSALILPLAFMGTLLADFAVLRFVAMRWPPPRAWTWAAWAVVSMMFNLAIPVVGMLVAFVAGMGGATDQDPLLAGSCITECIAWVYNALIIALWIRTRRPRVPTTNRAFPIIPTPNEKL